MSKVLFLDRDGVINVDHGYLYQAEQFEFIDGVFAACRAFQLAGFEIVVVTNQSGIGRGYYSEQDFHKLTEWMVNEFALQGINILDVMFCPHHPEKAVAPYLQQCDCRKPAPGMLTQALEKHNLDPKMSIIVGDKSSDIQAGINAGLGHKFLVRTGKTVSEQGEQLADAVFDDLQAVARHFLA